MKTYRTLILLYTSLIYAFSLAAQSKQDTIIAHFNLLKNIPGEKLYLHLDKPFYGAGENIWFKGYLVNAISHKNDAKSNFIITELVNRTDSVLQRKKIRRDSLGFENAIILPPNLPEGEYNLRGYTNWMLNSEPDFFFSRNLKIGNAIDRSIVANIEYEQLEGDDYQAKIRFSNDGKTPYDNINIKFQYFEDGKSKDKGRKKTDANGCIYIPLNHLSSTGKKRLELDFDDERYAFHKTFYLPILSKDYDVSFFPEGGALLAVPHQNVAFKAQGANGFSKKVQGILLSATGDTLTNFQTEHDGMGSFMFSPTIGDSYRVVVTSDEGITKQIALPKVESTGINLTMVHYKNDIRYEIQKTEQTVWPDTMYLIAHTRGQLIILQPISPDKLTGKLSDELLDDGITHFLLADGRGTILSERLIFNYKPSSTQWQVTPDKAIYGKREKIALQISAKDPSGNPLKGNFSISITDRKSVQQDSIADNILSNLLLTSDLKGYIENPGYYFLNQNAETNRNINLVMMTHGWRRHKITNLLQPSTINLNYFIEQGQTISGKIKGFFGNNIKKGPIYALAPKQNIIATTETNENGEFIINTSFKDSTVFVVQARTKRGFAGVDINIDQEYFPQVKAKEPFNDAINWKIDEYLLSTRDRYYMEGGIRVYNLKEVVVTSRRPKASNASPYVGINAYTMEGDKLQAFGSRTALDIVRTLPGVMVNGNGEVHIRTNPTQPVIVVDNALYQDDTSILEIIQSSDIESLSLIKDASANIFGFAGAGGAIILTLKEGKDIPGKPSKGLTTYSPLGYSDGMEFYHPTYETPAKKANQNTDLRTTIYWNPELRLDENGETTIEYYTPDSTSPHDIVIEGVDENGTIHRFTKTINQ